MLKSNGLHCPKIRLKKFGFSPKTVPANIAKKLPLQLRPKPLLIAFFNLSHKRPTFAFTAKVRTHSALPTGSHTRAHTAKQVAFWVGVVSLPSERSARSRTSPGRVSERQVLPLLGLGPVCFRRTQRAFGTAMRLCVSLSRRRRGPAGLRDLFRFCRNRDLYIRRSWFSACARQGWYHYSRCAPYAAETPGSRLSKRLTCRFLVSPIYICESPRRMQPISASIQIACRWISCGQTACP